MKNLYIIILLILLSSCSNRNVQNNNQLTSIKILDRNGFNETVSSSDRLKLYARTDFLSPQPYEKVVRIYSSNKKGKTPSKLTTYHSNGELWQYLEVIDGRASGKYREWHENGAIRIDLTVLEGIGDLSEEAQLSWIFDGCSKVFDRKNQLLAEFYYEKGKLQGNAVYYHLNGEVSKIIPYENDLIHGEILYYDNKGGVLGKSPYNYGERDGVAIFKGDPKQPAYSEKYSRNLLIEASYYDFAGKIKGLISKGNGSQIIYENGTLTTIREYQDGYPQGKVEKYESDGSLSAVFHIKDGKKHGEEWVYYNEIPGDPPKKKLFIQWSEDNAQGITRTWYSNGVLESERELLNGQKHGISSCWYKDGSLMMVEEYENNLLYKGTYRRKGEDNSVSMVENGKGTATLFDSEGIFLKRVSYNKGVPVDEI